jgi:hypothetical protein
VAIDILQPNPYGVSALPRDAAYLRGVPWSRPSAGVGAALDSESVMHNRGRIKNSAAVRHPPRAEPALCFVLKRELSHAVYYENEKGRRAVMGWHATRSLVLITIARLPDLLQRPQY